MKPTIGRIVHYTAPGQDVRAALITGVNPDGTVALRVFSAMRADEDEALLAVPESGYGAGEYESYGMWAWPAREG